MGTKHTAGPWQLSDATALFPDTTVYAGTLSDPTVIHYGTADEEGVANAHLIKAAPDLYNACQAALDVCEHSHIREILRAALSRAEGGDRG